MLNCTGSCLLLFGLDINLYCTYYLREGGWIAATPRMETAVGEPHEENRDGGSAFPDEILPDYKDYIQFPISILFLTLLYCGEAASALYLFDIYRKNDDIFWMSFTIGFLLVGVVLDQAILLLFQKDLRKHKFLFVGHILLLGPMVR